MASYYNFECRLVCSKQFYVVVRVKLLLIITNGGYEGQSNTAFDSVERWFSEKVMRKLIQKKVLLGFIQKNTTYKNEYIFINMF